MRADSETWLAREEATTSAAQDIDFQTAYVRDLLDATDYPDFNVEAVADLLFARAAEVGATFIMVTHDEALAAYVRARDMLALRHLAAQTGRE